MVKVFVDVGYVIDSFEQHLGIVIRRDQVPKVREIIELAIYAAK